MLLQVERVAKSYGAEKAADARPPVLEDFSLDLEENELVTVLGPSGCGKTTLLRLLAGLELPDAGRIVFDGRPVQGPGADRVVVFQQPALYPWLDVRRNIAFGLRLASRKVDWAAVEQTIEIVGLRGYERHRTYELSGGMQQRVALARALVMSPKMLLLDEPFAALDAHLRRSMQEFLLAVWDRIKTTILFITHDVDEAILLADRVIVMRSAPDRSVTELRVDLHRPRTEAVLADARFRELRAAAVALLGASPPPGRTASAERPEPAARAEPAYHRRRQRNGGNEMTDQLRTIFAASFATPEGGSRAGGALAGGFPDKVGNTAVLQVEPDGTPRFVESRDWGAGRGALVGGAIGILAGPIGILAGGGIGALAAKLRDSGFKDEQLEQLGRSLGPGHSAVVVEVAADTVEAAKALVGALGATESVVVELDSSVADLFSEDKAPVPAS